MSTGTGSSSFREDGSAISSSRRQRIALLGAGYIAQSHARAIQAIPGLELYAVCDHVVGRARTFGEEYGVAHVFDSVAALAESECDAVHVLLPPSHHLDAARTLILAGKSVLLEKPMGPDPAACHALDLLAQEQGVRLGVSHNFLFLDGYQPIRDAVREKRFGTIDQLTLNWLYELPQLHFGPFDGWMFAEPRNLVLELGSHLAAFALDLAGPVELVASEGCSAIELPGRKSVLRRWYALGSAGRSSIVFNLATTPGRVDRSFSLRSLGALIYFDFEKGIGWIDAQASDNPVIDHLVNSSSIARQIWFSAIRNFGRYFGRSLRKQGGANPFLDSISRSVAAFYADGPLDARLSASFGTRVIELCSEIAANGLRSQDLSRATSAPRSEPAGRVDDPDTLVIGGTGFIGKQLVRRLCQGGHRVRVMTRNRSVAQIEFAGLDVDIFQGSHGSSDDIKQALSGIGTVFHLAKAEGKKWDDYIRNDIEPTRTLAIASVEAGVTRFIYTGTIDSFDSSSARSVIGTDTPVDRAIATRNLYARSKAACEVLLAQLAETRGLPLVIARPGIVIGPASPPTHLGVAQFLSPTHVRYWGGGENLLPFVLVDDVAEGLALAATAPDVVGRELLLCDVPLMSARDYVAAMSNAAGISMTGERYPAWRHWISDFAKEAVKHAVRHPNRRKSTLHDWACKAHLARYDPSETCALLGWQPAGSSSAMISQAIAPSVERFLK